MKAVILLIVASVAFAQGGNKVESLFLMQLTISIFPRGQDPGVDHHRGGLRGLHPPEGDPDLHLGGALP